MRFSWTLSISLALALGVTGLAGCDSDDDDGSSDNGNGDGDGDGDDGGVCGDEWADKDGVGGEEQRLPYMGYGEPCTQDSDCSGLGEGAFCVINILEVFDIPGGFCSKTCSNDTDSTFEADDPECSPDGGVDCVGINGAFVACLPTCDDNDQCGREGYGCRRMPLISVEGDPTYCLMDNEVCCSAPDPGSCQDAN